jgi:membrane protein DedA with SNARE-associated domain
METIHNIILNFGYSGIFGLLMFGIIGLPVPDETLLAFCGYLANKGELRIEFTLLAAFLGSCSGITVSYLIGRFPGFALLRRYGQYIRFPEGRILQVHRWFEKVGKWLLLVGYFIPGFRHLAAMVAGSSRLSYLEFAPFAYTGALLWSATFVGAGYFFGKEWQQMSGRARFIFLLIAGSILIVALSWWLIHRTIVRNGRRKISS